MPSDERRLSPLRIEDPVKEQPSCILKLTVEIPSSHQPTADTTPRWKTLEFFFYYVMFIAVMPVMVWIPVALSSPEHQNYQYYKRKLSPGWLFGRQVDNSDAQYRSFRNNLPALVLLSSAFFLFKFLYRLRRSPDTHLDRIYLIPFIRGFSILMLLGLHGASALKILIIISTNYLISRHAGGSSIGPLFCWVFNALVLFANETYSGYRFASLHSSLEFMDNIQGAYPRWHVSFNITMLRLVSFGMDYHWAVTQGSQKEMAMSHKQRTSSPHPLEMYTFSNYLAYILYPPLYIAGPIITFNDFMWQMRSKNTLTWNSLAGYAVRFLVCLLTMECILHYMYMVAIKDTKAWDGFSAAELSLVGFWNLIIVWLKLLLPWRFFRLWALVDGIDPPENMVRCMANNYSTFGFWKSWHRSYNLWIVRYIYIPLGGTRNVLVSSLLIFTFVALWHDLSFKLLAWGWLVSLFLIPELIARTALPQSKAEWWYRHVCAVGGVFNILTMLAANLVGFVIGTDGISYMIGALTDSWKGIRFVIFTCSCLFIGVQIMFEYRYEELRAGIVRKC
ncbi:MBOAT-domain-containing protein [Thelephora terrestris]|uniref:MBOAT-domain-containing protein n=1 Tax=Thelephora terrestris TaxID=56493 RepID=A0A9P6LA24_9AGAM|nr:MBOAT-domain-containing protein [Thelephora terrestris]